MTSHLKIKIRGEEEFRKAREWLKTCGLSDAESAIFIEALDVYQDFNAVMREKNISIENLKDVAFGAGTEKTQSLFDDVNVEPINASENDNTDSEKTERTRKRKKKKRGHGRRNLKLHVHAQVVPCKHPQHSAGSACPACKAGRLHTAKPLTKTCIRAASLFIVQVYELENLRCGACQSTTSAAEPEELKACYGKYHPSAIATLAVLRYAFGMPSYRMRALTAIQGLEISDTTQFRLFEFACACLSPVLRCLAQIAANCKTCHRDDSPKLIIDMRRQLREEKRKAIARGDPPESARTGITTTVFTAKTYEGRVVTLYATGVEHAGEVFDDIVQARTVAEKIMAMADAASLNRDHSHGAKTIEAACLTHARRNFYRLRNYYPKEVETVLGLFAHVYAIDDRAKEQGMCDEDRLLLHKELSTTHMHTLFALSKIKRMEHEENSSIWKAYQYLENHWERLTAFLHHPGAPLENSDAERDLKWSIRHRNNSLFYRTDYGAFVGDTIMSIVNTAQKAGINPIQYIEALIINREVVKKRPEDWLPWNWREVLQAKAS